MFVRAVGLVGGVWVLWASTDNMWVRAEGVYVGGSCGRKVEAGG